MTLVVVQLLRRPCLWGGVERNLFFLRPALWVRIYLSRVADFLLDGYRLLGSVGD